MTIDIDELRFSAANSVRDLALLPSEVLELIDRLEEAERKVEMLNSLLDAKRRDHAVVQEQNRKLRAKIEAMEQQEPVGEIQRANSTGNYICSEVWVPLPVGTKLYALPGAQGDEK